MKLKHQVKKLKKKMIEKKKRKQDTQNDCQGNSCPQCDDLNSPITKKGIDFNPTARYDAVETIYTICGECNYIYSWGL